MKSVKCWGIINRFGYLIRNCSRDKRWETVSAACRRYNLSRRDMKKRGLKPIKITITEGWD